MREGRAVSIDTASERPVVQAEFDAVVLVDVLCETTTLVTAAAQRRQVFPAASAPAALALAHGLRDPIIATSERSNWRSGFEMGDSPAALARRSDARPFVLACETGRLLAERAQRWPDVYLACLRNVGATARHLALRHERVLVIDSGSDDVRCEDRIAAARLAQLLVDEGFAPLGLETHETLSRWAAADLALAEWGRSAEELRRARREEDLDFVLAHIDDVDVVCSVSSGCLKTLVPAELGQPQPVIA